MNSHLWRIVVLVVVEVAQMTIGRWIDQKADSEENERKTKGGPRMPTFKFNSEQPYYQDGRLVKKVKTQHNLSRECIQIAPSWGGLRRFCWAS